jgi:hypothetical protein
MISTAHRSLNGRVRLLAGLLLDRRIWLLSAGPTNSSTAFTNAGVLCGDPVAGSERANADDVQD